MSRHPQAVFLDRDGTLIENKHYLRDPAGVVVLPGVREALTRAVAAKVRLFLFTNQSGVGRGLLTLADVEAVNQRMIELLGVGEAPFAAICIAPEHPDEVPRYRKPSPRFILEMLDRHDIEPSRAWMVGDSPSDWQAGLNAGISTAAIVPRSEAISSAATRPHSQVRVYDSLLAWAEDVLG